jgi:hypothetical protein
LSSTHQSWHRVARLNPFAQAKTNAKQSTAIGTCCSKHNQDLRPAAELLLLLLLLLLL